MCLAAGFAGGDPDSYMIPRWSWASEDGAPQLRQLRDVQAWRRYVDGLKCLKPRAAQSSDTPTGSSPSSNACQVRTRRDQALS